VKKFLIARLKHLKLYLLRNLLNSNIRRMITTAVTVVPIDSATFFLHTTLIQMLLLIFPADASAYINIEHTIYF
jgi:hypothetical protein